VQLYIFLALSILLWSRAIYHLHIWFFRREVMYPDVEMKLSVKRNMSSLA